MKPKVKRTICAVIIICIMVFGLISFLSPELTIRRYILFRLHPIRSITADVLNSGGFDQNYGYLYDVDGYKERNTGDEINVFYLKKYGPFWVVSSVGTGP